MITQKMGRQDKFLRYHPDVIPLIVDDIKELLTNTLQKPIVRQMHTYGYPAKAISKSMFDNMIGLVLNVPLSKHVFAMVQEYNQKAVKSTTFRIYRIEPGDKRERCHIPFNKMSLGGESEKSIIKDLALSAQFAEPSEAFDRIEKVNAFLEKYDYFFIDLQNPYDNSKPKPVFNNSTRRKLLTTLP